jgi:hypothetical protein
MANDCSRSFDLTDPQLLAYFDTVYPQNEPWQLRHLRPVMNSALVISSLQCKRLQLQAARDNLWETWQLFCIALGALSSYAQLTNHPSLSYKSLPAAIKRVESSIVVTWPSLEQWRKPSTPLGARLSCWGPKILV